MRTLRWAAERAISGDVAESRLGIAALDSLGGAAWLDPEDQRLIDSLTAAVTTPAASYYEAGHTSTGGRFSGGRRALVHDAGLAEPGEDASSD